MYRFLARRRHYHKVSNFGRVKQERVFQFFFFEQNMLYMHLPLIILEFQNRTGMLKNIFSIISHIRCPVQKIFLLQRVEL